MSGAAQVNGPSGSGKYIDGIDPEDPEYIKNLQRPAEVKEDIHQMENRSRVKVVLNSESFKEELEEIVDEQLRSGPYPASLLALQQINELLMPGSRGGLSNLGRASTVIPVNDLRGSEHVGSSKGEKLLRCKLASLYRLVDLCGWTQGIYNHISARVSADVEQFLLNPFGMMYSEITASSLVKVDVNGDIVDPGTSHFSVNKAGFTLHSAIHQARPDLKCVVHLHSPAAVAVFIDGGTDIQRIDQIKKQLPVVSAMKCGLLPISQEALICGNISYHDYQGIFIDAEEKEKLARNLGVHNKVMILRNHGIVACGETIEEAFHYTVNVINACEAQIRAIPAGLDNLILPSEEARQQAFKVSSRGGGGVETSGKKWKSGELEFEALMRTLDNSGYRTGYMYRMPMIKQDKKDRSNSEVEIPPSSSSFTYVFDGDFENSKYVSPLKMAQDRQKKAFKAGWLTSPNAYKKTELEEIGTTTPKKITKWVPDGETQNKPGGVNVKLENPNQFAPQGENPKEFKQKQKSIKKDYYEERVNAGPQSKILEGISWDEAQKAKDGQLSGAGDQVIVVGAASKGIIQRDHQHNAVVYRQYYAANPFENMSEAEIGNYQDEVQKKEPSEQESMEPPQEEEEDSNKRQEAQDTEEANTRQTELVPEVSDKPVELDSKGQDAFLAQLADTVVQTVMHDALAVARQRGGKGQQILTGRSTANAHQHTKFFHMGGQMESVLQNNDQRGDNCFKSTVNNDSVLGKDEKEVIHIGDCQKPLQSQLFEHSGKESKNDSGATTNNMRAPAYKDKTYVDEETSTQGEFVTLQINPILVQHGAQADGMKVKFSIHSTVRRRISREIEKGSPIEEIYAAATQPIVHLIHSDVSRSKDASMETSEPEICSSFVDIKSIAKTYETKVNKGEFKDTVNTDAAHTNENLQVVVPKIIKNEHEEDRQDKKKIESHSETKWKIKMEENQSVSKSDMPVVEEGSLKNKISGYNQTNTSVFTQDSRVKSNNLAKKKDAQNDLQKPKIIYHKRVKSSGRKKRNTQNNVPLSPVREIAFEGTEAEMEDLGAILEAADDSFEQLLITAEDDLLLCEKGRDEELNLSEFRGISPLAEDEIKMKVNSTRTTSAQGEKCEQPCSVDNVSFLQTEQASLGNFVLSPNKKSVDNRENDCKSVARDELSLSTELKTSVCTTDLISQFDSVKVNLEKANRLKPRDNFESSHFEEVIPFADEETPSHAGVSYVEQAVLTYGNKEKYSVKGEGMNSQRKTATKDDCMSVEAQTSCSSSPKMLKTDIPNIEDFPHKKAETSVDDIIPHKKAETSVDDVIPHKKAEKRVDDIIPHKKAEKRVDDIIPHKKAEKRVDDIIPHKKTETSVDNIIPLKKAEIRVDDIIPLKKAETRMDDIIPHKKVETSVDDIIPHRKAETNVDDIIPHKKAKTNVDDIIPQKKAETNVDDIIPHRKTETCVHGIVPNRKAETNVDHIIPHNNFETYADATAPPVKAKTNGVGTNPPAKTETSVDHIIPHKKPERSVDDIAHKKAETSVDDVIPHKKAETNNYDIIQQKKSETNVDDIIPHKKAETNVDDIIPHKKAETNVDDIIPHKKPERSVDDIAHKKAETSVDDVIPHKKAETNNYDIIQQKKSETNVDDIIPHKKAETNVDDIIPHKKAETNVDDIIPHKKAETNVDDIIPHKKAETNVDDIIPHKKAETNDYDIIRHKKAETNVDDIIPHKKAETNVDDVIPHKKAETNMAIPPKKAETNIDDIINVDDIYSPMKAETSNVDDTPLLKKEINLDDIISQRKTETDIDDIIPHKKAETNIDDIVPYKKAETNVDDIIPRKKAETNVDDIISHKKAKTSVDDIIPHKKTETNVDDIPLKMNEINVDDMIPQRKTETNIDDIIPHKEDVTETYFDDMITHERDETCVDDIPHFETEISDFPIEKKETIIDSISNDELETKIFIGTITKNSSKMNEDTILHETRTNERKNKYLFDTVSKEGPLQTSSPKLSRVKQNKNVSNDFNELCRSENTLLDSLYNDQNPSKFEAKSQPVLQEMADVPSNNDSFLFRSTSLDPDQLIDTQSSNMAKRGKCEYLDSEWNPLERSTSFNSSRSVLDEYHLKKHNELMKLPSAKSFLTSPNKPLFHGSSSDIMPPLPDTMDVPSISDIEDGDLPVSMDSHPKKSTHLNTDTVADDAVKKSSSQKGRWVPKSKRNRDPIDDGSFSNQNWQARSNESVKGDTKGPFLTSANKNETEATKRNIMNSESRNIDGGNLEKEKSSMKVKPAEVDANTESVRRKSRDSQRKSSEKEEKWSAKERRESNRSEDFDRFASMKKDKEGKERSKELGHERYYEDRKGRIGERKSSKDSEDHKFRKGEQNKGRVEDDDKENRKFNSERDRDDVSEKSSKRREDKQTNNSDVKRRRASGKEGKNERERRHKEDREYDRSKKRERNRNYSSDEDYDDDEKYMGRRHKGRREREKRKDSNDDRKEQRDKHYEGDNVKKSKEWLNADEKARRGSPLLKGEAIKDKTKEDVDNSFDDRSLYKGSLEPEERRRQGGGRSRKLGRVSDHYYSPGEERKHSKDDLVKTKSIVDEKAMIPSVTKLNKNEISPASNQLLHRPKEHSDPEPSPRLARRRGGAIAPDEEKLKKINSPYKSKKDYLTIPLSNKNNLHRSNPSVHKSNVSLASSTLSRRSKSSSRIFENCPELLPPKEQLDPVTGEPYNFIHPLMSKSMESLLSRSSSRMHFHSPERINDSYRLEDSIDEEARSPNPNEDMDESGSHEEQKKQEQWQRAKAKKSDLEVEKHEQTGVSTHSKKLPTNYSEKENRDGNLEKKSASAVECDGKELSETEQELQFNSKTDGENKPPPKKSLFSRLSCVGGRSTSVGKKMNEGKGKEPLEKRATVDDSSNQKEYYAAEKKRMKKIAKDKETSQFVGVYFQEESDESGPEDENVSYNTQLEAEPRQKHRLESKESKSFSTFAAPSKSTESYKDYFEQPKTINSDKKESGKDDSRKTTNERKSKSSDGKYDHRQSERRDRKYSTEGRADEDKESSNLSTKKWQPRARRDKESTLRPRPSKSPENPNPQFHQVDSRVTGMDCKDSFMTDTFNSTLESDVGILSTSAPAHISLDRGCFPPKFDPSTSFDVSELSHYKKHARRESYDWDNSFPYNSSPPLRHPENSPVRRRISQVSLGFESGATRPRSSSTTTNPLTYQPWRSKAKHRGRSMSISEMVYAAGVPRPTRSHSVGEITYNNSLLGNVGRRRSRTNSLGEIVVTSRMYHRRRSRSHSRASLGDTSFGSVAPGLQRRQSGSWSSHPAELDVVPPAPVKRSESAREPSKNADLIEELGRKNMERTKSDRQPQIKEELGEDKPVSPSKSDTMKSTDSASGGETLEERSSKEGSPTKEHPSTKDKKGKKKKFRIPSFSKKKNKEAKESAI